MLNFAMEGAMPSAAAYLQFLPIIVLIVLFYFLLIRPQRKRDKADKEMRDSIVAGDRICTIGGIIGKVVQVTDEEILLDTCGSRMRFSKWAIRSKIEKGSDDAN